MCYLYIILFLRHGSEVLQYLVPESVLQSVKPHTRLIIHLIIEILQLQFLLTLHLQHTHDLNSSYMSIHVHMWSYRVQV